MILFLLKMRISHRPWLLVCLLIRLAVRMLCFGAAAAAIQSLLFWLTTIFFQTIFNIHTLNRDRNWYSIEVSGMARNQCYLSANTETKLTNFYKLRHMLHTHKLHKRAKEKTWMIKSRTMWYGMMMTTMMIICTFNLPNLFYFVQYKKQQCKKNLKLASVRHLFTTTMGIQKYLEQIHVAILLGHSWTGVCTCLAFVIMFICLCLLTCWLAGLHCCNHLFWILVPKNRHRRHWRYSYSGSCAPRELYTR